jgi:hypothetical protein
MKIISTSRTANTLEQDDGRFTGSLLYKNEPLNEAKLSCEKEYTIYKQSPGSWVTSGVKDNILSAVCKVRVDGTITLILGNKQYTFKKPFSWKLRFTLLNAEKEEMLALLPSANWKIHSYNFAPQLNDEFANETSSFVILQALHCAVCSMAMMNDTIISAVIFKA